MPNNTVFQRNGYVCIQNKHTIIRVMSEEKPYNCGICGKSYLRKEHLTKHMLIHNGDRPLECRTCGKSFTQKWNLTHHMLIHTGNKPHTCGTCGKSFTWKSNLARHMLIIPEINNMNVELVENHLH